MRFTRIVGLVAGMSLIAVGAAGAQDVAFSPTGASNWKVKCEQLNFGGNLNACPTDGMDVDGFRAAAVVSPEAAGWVTTPHNGAYWISSLSSGSISPDVGNENPNYKYTFRTYLELTSAGDYEIHLTDLHLDNYFVAVYVNGQQVTDLAVSPLPLPPNGGNWTTEFTAFGTSGDFIAGQNEFDIVITGNGRTDGLLAQGFVRPMAGGTVVPEPGTFVLLTGGLGLLGLAARKRRRS